MFDAAIPVAAPEAREDRWQDTPAHHPADTMMVLHIPTVPKAEYPTLKNTCSPDVAGECYGDFVKLVNETAKDARKLGIEPVKIRIDPGNLSLWLNGRKAEKKDLLRYAAAISDMPLVPSSDGLLTRPVSPAAAHRVSG